MESSSFCDLPWGTKRDKRIAEKDYRICFWSPVQSSQHAKVLYFGVLRNIFGFWSWGLKWGLHTELYPPLGGGDLRHCLTIMVQASLKLEAIHCLTILSRLGSKWDHPASAAPHPPSCWDHRGASTCPQDIHSYCPHFKWKDAGLVHPGPCFTRQTPPESPC